MKKIWSVGLIVQVALFSVVSAAEIPEFLASRFVEDKPVIGEIIAVIPPKEFDGFVQKISEAARKDPEWFNEHSKKSAGSPIPLYDEKFGMTQEEYDGYKKIWAQRTVEKLADTSLMLTAAAKDQWQINASGRASTLSLLRYDPEKNVFISPNGELSAIDDLAAPADSLLGAWSGKEWRFLSENSLSKVKENVVLGSSNDGKYSYLIYRLQEADSRGKPLFDKSLVIRFAAKKAK